MVDRAPDLLSSIPPEQDLRLNDLQATLKDRGLTMLDHVEWLNSTHSTNDVIKQLDKNCALMLSNQQTAGRGQSGRTWYSPEGNLYLSLLWTLQQPLSGRLALEVALSLVNMPLLSHYPQLKVKWPNDLYFNHAKWGGILIEPLSDNRVVIGVGLNLNAMPDMVENQLATDLNSITGKSINILELATQTTVALIDACHIFDQSSLNLAQRFAQSDALFEQAVTVSNPAQPTIDGIAMGIQADGALVLNTETGQKIIYSGQVRPRL